MSDEYWLISIPAESAPRQRYDKLCVATSREQLAQNYLFHIPDLKVGTLDSLVALSDDFARLDSYIEGY